MKRKIKIVFVSASTQGGGAERMQLNIMHSLSEEKFDITFINTSTEPKPQDLNEYVNYIQYNKLHGRQSFWNLLSDLRKINPKYVFTTSIVIAYLLQVVRLFAILRFKLVVRIAVPPSESPHIDIKSRILRKINATTLKFTDVVIAQTEFSKTDIAKYYNMPLHKILVIRNIVDKSMLESKGNEYYPAEFACENYNIVAAGALYSVKGFDLAIDAMKLVVDKNKEIRLYILGEERYEIGYRNKLLKQISDNCLQDYVFLLGQKSNPYPYYKYSNLFVMSSRTEGFPNVLLEALYFGTPVVATNCVDFSGVITEGVNGFVVEKESQTAIAEGINRAIEQLEKSSDITIQNFNYNELFL